MMVIILVLVRKSIVNPTKKVNTIWGKVVEEVNGSNSSASNVSVTMEQMSASMQENSATDEQIAAEILQTTFKVSARW